VSDKRFISCKAGWFVCIVFTAMCLTVSSEL
jgi:hypothetical protein